MRRILFWGVLILIGMYIAGGMPAWGEEQPRPPTPEQIVEAALEGMLNWKIKYGKETIFAAEMQTLALNLEKIVKVLNEKLKAANTKIAQLELKGEEE